MLSRYGRPILVTGSHRSGTTWVGRMLASHPRVHYVKEPFNPRYQPGCPVVHQWHHVTDEDADCFRTYLDGLFRPRCAWWDEVRARPHPRAVAGATLRALDVWKRRLVGSRPLMKDPVAFFSAEWLAATFAPDVVVLVRHPAAFAGSVKELGWTFPFDHLLRQPCLVETYLASFHDDIRRAQAGRPDLIGHAILAWRIFHHLILQYRVRHPDWTFIRHEDLSLRPLEEFRRLFRRLRLSFPGRVQRTIAEHSAAANGDVGSGHPGELRRDSRSNVRSWARRLRPEEVARIRKGTEDVAWIFYPERGWWDAAGVPLRTVG